LLLAGEVLALVEKVRDYLRGHPEASANEVYKDVGGNRPKILAAVKQLRDSEAEVLAAVEELAG
jgi:hypothetical protein